MANLKARVEIRLLPSFRKTKLIEEISKLSEEISQVLVNVL